MTTKTKYDAWVEKNTIREKRENNVALLEAKLKRARDLEAVIPMGADSYELDEQLRNERRLITSMISELEDMLQDEIEAVNNIEVPEYESPSQNGGF